jgi:hypothetical protein
VGATVNMIAPEGGTHAVPEEEVEGARKAGWVVEGAASAQSRMSAEAREEAYGGLGGTVAASIAGGARGASLGVSDLVASVLGTQGDVDTLENLREVNPTASLVSEIAGAVVPSLASGGTGVAGSLARATPAGAVSNVAAKIAAPAGAGLAATVGRGAAAGAVEGAAGGAGAYLTEIALEDKPLSAEGFAASMGKGALWGGAAGGALGLSERALTSARSLFPKQQYTAEAAQEAEDAFSRELGNTLRDSDELQAQAQQQVAIATERAMTNPEARAAIMAARVRKAEADAARSEHRLATQQAREAERAARGAAKGAKSAPTGMTDDAVARAKAQINADMDAAMAAAPAPRSIDPADILGPGPRRAPDPRPGATAPDDLEAALRGTKQRLDAGEDIATIGRKSSAEDEIADIVAAADPEAAPLVLAARAERMTRAEVDDWIGSMSKRAREKAAKTGMSTGYRNTLEAGPFGGASRKTDRVNLPVGDDAAFAAQRSADDAYFDARNARFDEMDDAALLADRQAKQAAGKARRKGAGGPPRLADVAIPAPGPAESVADVAAAALRGKVDVDGEDLAEGIRRIGAHEAAMADLAEALPNAPATAVARAADYRAAAAAANEKAVGQAVNAGDAAAKAIRNPAAAVAAGTDKPGTMASALRALGDAGAFVEMMQTLGIPGMPDIDKIPVIGPVLGMLLKARAASAAYRRLFGRGTMPQTAEGVIANRSAKARERAMAAIDKALAGGAKAAGVARKAAPAATLALSHRLFEGGKDDSDGDPVKAYNARMDEIARASRPGAIADALRARVRTSDPALLKELVAAQERKIAYLQTKIPKRPSLPTVLAGGRSQWIPSKAELTSFGRIMEAVEDPVGTLERMADGGDITLEAAEAIRKVYPKMFAEAQRRLVERVGDPEAAPLPYNRRIQLSILFDVPLDGTLAPQYIGWLQDGYPAPQPPPGAAPPGAPPVPGIAADLSSVGQATATALDQRAGG